MEELFPEGIDRNKIWTALVPILRQESCDHSGDVLEAVANCKLGLKQRIQEHFPSVADQWYIISWGDTDLLRRVTDRMWLFARSHAQHSQDVIVLHCGFESAEPHDFLLDWAAQAVVTMMLEYVGKSL